MIQPLISIIVPCYNVKKYLPDFFLCLINQTYENVEVILVDDGSTDGTGNFLEDFAKTRHNVTVIHQSNGGSSAARNTGIKIAKGKYLYFPDPDDVFHPDIISIMYKLICESDAEIAICGFKKIKDNQRYFNNFKSFKNIKSILVTKSDEIMSRHLGLVAVSTWTRLLSHEIVRRMENYPNVFVVGCTRGEDSLFFAQYMTLCSKCVITKTPLYYYRQRCSSLAHANFSEKYLSIYWSHEYLKKLDPNIYKITQNYIKSSICIDSIDCINRIAHSVNFHNPKIAQMVYKRYRENVKYLIKCKYYPAAYRFGIPLSPIGIYFMIRKYLK